MTQEEIEAYKKDPYYCPECKSEDFEMANSSWYGLAYLVEYKCNDCQFEWEEEYKLATVRPVNEA